LNKIHLYFRLPPQKDRYIPGDHYIFFILRKLFRKKKTSGIEKVFLNLCRGFEELKVNYDTNLPFKKIKPQEPVVVLGVGEFSLQGYEQPNLVIAGVGLMGHPSEWPDLFKEYPIAKYLQHSDWATNIYKPYYGSENCEIWPAGIDTQKWAPNTASKITYDVLIYNKIMWDKPQTESVLKQPVLQKLYNMGISYREIKYGYYNEDEYYRALQHCRAMIFLCEHESQGFACCEALSMNIPVFAWDQGYWLDPHRFNWNDPVIPSTSVPWFDDRCGKTFKNFDDFNDQIPIFWQMVKNNCFKPREFVLENLSLKISAQKMLEIIDAVYNK
jgi:glycosyltransferase involved in cell wall biosynthesis